MPICVVDLRNNLFLARNRWNAKLRGHNIKLALFARIRTVREVNGTDRLDYFNRCHRPGGVDFMNEDGESTFESVSSESEKEENKNKDEEEEEDEQDKKNVGGAKTGRNKIRDVEIIIPVKIQNCNKILEYFMISPSKEDREEYAETIHRASE